MTIYEFIRNLSKFSKLGAAVDNYEFRTDSAIEYEMREEFNRLKGGMMLDKPGGHFFSMPIPGSQWCTFNIYQDDSTSGTTQDPIDYEHLSIRLYPDDHVEVERFYPYNMDKDWYWEYRQSHPPVSRDYTKETDVTKLVEFVTDFVNRDTNDRRHEYQIFPHVMKVMRLIDAGTAPYMSMELFLKHLTLMTFFGNIKPTSNGIFETRNQWDANGVDVYGTNLRTFIGPDGFTLIVGGDEIKDRVLILPEKQAIKIDGWSKLYPFRMKNSLAAHYLEDAFPTAIAIPLLKLAKIGSDHGSKTFFSDVFSDIIFHDQLGTTVQIWENM